MNYQVEPTRSRPPMVKRAAAGLVLIVAAVIAIKIVVGIVTAAFLTILAIAVLVAVLWAIKQLVW